MDSDPKTRVHPHLFGANALIEPYLSAARAISTENADGNGHQSGRDSWDSSRHAVYLSTYRNTESFDYSATRYLTLNFLTLELIAISF